MSTDKRYVPISKFMSYLLRHHPPECMDDEGYVPVTEMLKMINEPNPDTGKLRFGLSPGEEFTKEQLDELVATNNKKRFAYNEDETLIRASQGHTIPVDLGMTPQTPPAVLYHGTATKYVSSILKQGLQKRSRQHVHLSQDTETAINVGQRHGKPQVLTVNTTQMVKDGYKFYLSANGVWLTDHVPPKYINQ